MGMYGNSIKVEARKDELLSILQANREKHVEDFRKATAGYVKAALEALDQRSRDFSATVEGEPIPDSLDLGFGNIPKPQSHEKDYDRAIKMLSMHQGESFIIDSDMYEMYVEDNWSWKRDFMHSTSHYGVGARPF
jgi:hypothetical protein